uniref:Uncharacterized protein n=1 Tax=Anguilla anguilla TaxID=7936 RepID=A0A0E9T7T4_ANGAN
MVTYPCRRGALETVSASLTAPRPSPLAALLVRDRARGGPQIGKYGGPSVFFMEKR